MDNLYILLSSLVCFIGLTVQFKSLLGSGSTRQQVTVCFTKRFIKPVVEKRGREEERKATQGSKVICPVSKGRDEQEDCRMSQFLIL